MKFYNRIDEIVQLQQYSNKLSKGVMGLLVGRRRIGKTSLLQRAFSGNKKFLYFFVSRKSEVLLCEEYLEELTKYIDTPILGNINKFKLVFEIILQASCKQPMTVVFDEFQEFVYINSSVYSDIQNLWDKYKNKSKIHLIFCGSIYSMMCKIFENSKEPLFSRLDYKIHLMPLKISYIQKILKDNNAYTANNLLSIYTIFNGVPRYLELLKNHSSWDLDKILETILSKNSFFLEEGKNILIEEFGKDYQVYFSILSFLSFGKTTRSAIESILQKDIGGYLDNLENKFDIIKKYQPVFAKPGSRLQKYYIEDHFLNFWFRYFYKNKSAIEIENYSYIIDIIKQDFSTYSGKYLEKIFRQKIADTKKYNIIGSYWEKDNNNEIDIIACNEKEKKILIAEVKLQKNKLNINKLKQKAEKIIIKHKNYHIEFKGFSLQDL